MNKILIKLFLFFSTHGLPLEKDLQTPLPDSVIQKKLMAAIGTVPNDLLQLYKWKNGVDINGTPSYFLDGCYMPDIELATEFYRRFQEMDSSINFYHYDYKLLFPVFFSGAGEYYFYCFDGAFKGKIIYESAGEFQGELVVAFNSLKKLCSSVFECYKLGFYYYDENKRWRRKPEEEWKLMQSLNPNCKRWMDEDEPKKVILIEQ